MGLIRAVASSISSTLGDEFKEYVECPPVEGNVILVRGVVNHGKGNSNPSENIISNGSAIVVPRGMAMMIIANGKVCEFSAEEGIYTWNDSSEPSIFTGSLGKGIVDTFKTIGRRITFGGQTADDQRVYYINTKQIPALTFGSQAPEIVADPVYGSVEVTYNGEYSIHIDDPIILFNTVIGSNPESDSITFDDIFSNEGGNILKSRFSQKISECISKIMIEKNVSFDKIQLYKSEITDQMNSLLNTDWHDKYGIVIDDVSLRIGATEESRKAIADINKTKAMGNVYSSNLTGTMAAATGEAMKSAASNENGAMMGFAGFGLSNQAGASVMNSVINNQQAGNTTNPQSSTVTAGVVSTGKKFCSNCGAPLNGTERFCANCGTKVE